MLIFCSISNLQGIWDEFILNTRNIYEISTFSHNSNQGVCLNYGTSCDSRYIYAANIEKAAELFDSFLSILNLKEHKEISNFYSLEVLQGDK